MAAASKARDAAGSIAALRAAADADKSDLGAQLALAQGLREAGMHKEAIDIAVAIVRADRDWNEGAARRFLLELFDTLGPKDNLTSQGRRALSKVLF
jgi:putative thioredoxin